MLNAGAQNATASMALAVWPRSGGAGLNGGEAENLERVCDLYGPALGRNRDEFEAMWRSLHPCASKTQREEIARFRPNPSGQRLCGRPGRGGLRRCESSQ